MKKITFGAVIIVLLLVLCSCASSWPVKQGAPLCREDFNFYSKQGTANDPDEASNGSVLLDVSDDYTARGIQFKDPIEKVVEAYKGVTADSIYETDNYKNVTLEDFLEEHSEYKNEAFNVTYSYSGYQLDFLFNSGKVMGVSSCTPEVWQSIQEDAKQEVEQDLRSAMGDKKYEEMFGES